MSRLSGIGLAAAALVMTLITATASFAAPPPPGAAAIDPAMRTAGMKAAPGLITEANVPCTLADARELGTGTAADKSQTTIYEIACKEGLGYIIGKETKAGAPLLTYNCLQTSLPMADGKPNTLACALPANANPALGLQPIVTQSGRNCTVDKARYLGPTPDKQVYEVSCQNGQGLVLLVPIAGGAPGADNCLAYGGAAGAIKCTLTTADQEIAPLDAVAASSGKCAAVKAKRYVLTTTDGSDYFEVACGDGKGYMIQVDHTGKLADTIACAEAFQIGGGCTLTDARQALTQQNAVYTDLSKKAGFDCAVSKYALFPSTDPAKDIVEMACSNRPDGGVGIFPAHGPAHVFDCLRSQDEGYKCSYTPVEALFPHLDAELKAKNKGGCVVSGARPFARGDDGSDFVEVACADGGPGWVLVYPVGAASPSELRNCVEVAKLAGGCQLPSNRKKT
jgi:hypothetical protein